MNDLLIFLPSSVVSDVEYLYDHDTPTTTSDTLPFPFFIIPRPWARSSSLESGVFDSQLEESIVCPTTTIMVAYFGICVAFICLLETFFISYSI